MLPAMLVPPLIFGASARSLKSLTAPGLSGIFLWSVALTILLLALFIMVVGALSVYFSGYLDAGPAAWAAIGGSVGGVILAWFLFPGIMPLIVNFFDDRIAGTIERHDYPHLPAAREVPFWPEILHDLRFSLTAIALNILCLPLYLIPLINVVLFYLLNGYLLGREFFVMAARRHMPRQAAEQLRRQHARAVLAGGMLLAFLATMPVVNFVAPFWGVALMTHLFHRLKGDDASPAGYAMVDVTPR